jgi:iron complex outermembrane receptor protein
LLDEVVVTATRRAESAQSVPLSITALTAEDLSSAGVTQTRDLVGLTPNLSEQGSYGREAPAFFIRGIGNTQFNPNGTSKVGVYVDDVYLNSPAVQGAQLFDIERVEVARGPQGTLFGQNTTGGLIRAITNKPRIGAGLTLDTEVTVGHFGEFDPRLSVGFDTGANSAARISLFDQNRDGISENTLLNKREGRTDVFSWRGQWLWQPVEDLEVLANVHGTRDRSGLVPYKQLGLFDPATGGRCAAPALGSGCIDPAGYADTANLYQGQWNVPNQHAWVDALGGSVTVNWKLPLATLTSVTGFERNTSRIGEDTDSGPFDLLRGSFFGHPKQISEELRLTSPEQRLRWLAGLYYFHEDLDSSVAFAAPGLGPSAFTSLFGIPSGLLEGVGQHSKLTTRSYAGFGNVEFAATERLKLELGLRLTHEQKDLTYGAFIDDVTGFGPSSYIAGDTLANAAIFQTIDFSTSRSWNNLSGRASVSYKLSDGVLAYTSFARGFNSGNYNGGAFLTQAEASLVNPETLKSYEVGLKTQFLGQLRFNIDAFYYDFSDEQVYIQNSTGGNVFQQLANAAASSLYGGEMELAWRPVTALTVQLGAGYTHSRFDSFHNSISGDLTGKTLPSAPKANLNALVRYEVGVPGGSLAFEVDDKYQSSQYFSVNNDPLLRQGAYSIADARISLVQLDQHLTVSAWIRNLADKAYLAGAYDLSTYGWDEYVPGEPRTYGLTVQYQMR